MASFIRRFMDNRYFNILQILFLIILIYSCKDSIVDPPDNKDVAIYGKVVDEQDNLLQDVAINYIFFFSQDIVLRTATISYSLDASQPVFLQIFDMYNSEIAKPLHGTNQPPGKHAYFFDGTNYTNGIYHYKISGQTFSKEGSFPLLTDDIGFLNSTTPLISTDKNGEFKLYYSIFNIGSEYRIEGVDNSLSIADSIKFVLHKEGFNDLMVPTKLDTTILLEKTFKMFNK
jgi:hypothetical protein